MDNLCISNTEHILPFSQLHYDACTSAVRRLIFLYIKQCQEISDNKIVNTGIVTLTNIFAIIILHTNNVPLALRRGEKSILYYFEFIEQIYSKSSSFQHTLDLDVNDAKIFVYKKSLYDITNKYELTPTSNIFFHRLRVYIDVLVAFFQLLITHGFVGSVVSRFSMLNDRLDCEFASNSLDNIIAYNIPPHCSFNTLVDNLLCTLAV